MKFQRKLSKFVGVGIALIVLSAAAATESAAALSVLSVAVTADGPGVTDAPPPGCYGCTDLGYDPDEGYLGRMGAPCELSGLQCARCEYNCEYEEIYWSLPCSMATCGVNEEFEQEMGDAITNGDARKIASLINVHSRNVSLDVKSSNVLWTNCNGNVDYKHTLTVALVRKVDLQLAAMRSVSVH
ncbi:MAG: hypothetical protein ABJB74_15080 [Gemmatimonas sp.]